MSSDEQLLAAFAMKTGQEMRYFELITVVNGKDKKKCYVCLGKHALYFMRQDLNGMIHGGGELFYSTIVKVFRDSSSRRHLMLILNDNKPEEWSSDKLFVQSDCREQFLKHLRCSWQTDRMWRLGRADALPLFEHSVTKAGSQLEQPLIDAFRGFQWQTHQGYRLMVPYGFEPKANSIQADETGEYADASGTSLQLHVHEQLSLDQLHALERDHIRWVAQEYRAQLVRVESQVYVIKNMPYEKRMNLVGDVAAWIGWELIIRSPAALVICILLRRQYVPPLCNCAQDIALVLRSPAGEGQKSLDQVLLLAHLIADSVCPAFPSMGVYPSMVQAKLDALRFDEEGVEWVGSHLKLRPRWYREAKIFLRKIIRLFVEDAALKDQYLLDLPAQQALTSAMPGEEWAELDAEVDQLDLLSFIRNLRDGGDGLPSQDQDPSKRLPDESRNLDDDLCTQNRWHSRVARYFAWAVDGGLLGPKFTLAKMIDNMPGLMEANLKSAHLALNFMLHLREKNFSKRWSDMNLSHMIALPDLHAYQCNDRVMLALLSTDYLRKQFGRKKEAAYVQCLAKMLEGIGGINLKAFICRLFMEMSGQSESNAELGGLLVSPLVNVMKNRGMFLATYASAALVNLSSENEPVKQMLVSAGIANVAIQQLKTKDDDLVVYTLMLLANLTKDPGTRSAIATEGLLPIIYEMLTSSYHQCCSKLHGNEVSSVGGSRLISSQMKERLLMQICVVIGQYCNDDLYHMMFLDKYSHTTKCVTYIYEHGTPGNHLACKAMFCLKQLAANRGDIKTDVGTQVIKKLIHDLSDNERVPEKSADFLNQSVLLLQMLSSIRSNIDRMGHEAIEVLQRVRTYPAASKLSGFQQRVQALQLTIQNELKMDFA